MSRTYEQLEPVISALDERIKTNIGAFPTDMASGAVASFADGADDIPLKSLVVNIDPVQSGSGDPSPDNVRPISGWTGAQVVRTGVNVWDEEWELGGIGETDGTPLVQTDRIRSKNYCPCVGDAEYYFHIPNTPLRVYFYDADKTYLTFYGYWGNARAFTTPTNARYFKILGSAAYGTTYNHDISINYPSTDHDYHPYNGNLYSITLPTEAGTVYGGTLDVTKGVLTVDRAMVTLSELTCAKNVGNYQTFIVTPSEAIATGMSIALVQSSTWKGVTQNQAQISDDNYVWGSSVDGTIRIKSTAHADMTANEFKATFADAQFVYKLATPLTIQLTPHEVKSLYGQNNIFADTGDTAAEYRADTKLYIERLTEPDADMIADSNIVSGQYFMVGNSLYLATSNIASGGQVIVGTNCTQKSLATALNEINQ